jgi:thioredoxin 1
VKVNVDEEPHLAAEYQITGIPAMKVFQNGKIVREMVGAKPKPALLADLEGLI